MKAVYVLEDVPGVGSFSVKEDGAVVLADDTTLTTNEMHQLVDAAFKVADAADEAAWATRQLRRPTTQTDELDQLADH